MPGLQLTGNLTGGWERRRQVVTREAVIEAVSAVAVDFGRIRKIYLFGSVVKGAQTEASDVDLCVETDEGFSLFDAGAFGSRVKAILGTDIDIVTEKSCRPHVAGSMRQERVLVYER